LKNLTFNHLCLCNLLPPSKKKKCLGTLFKDNEEEEDIMPIISKEQRVNNELQKYLSSPNLDLEQHPLKYWKEIQHDHQYLSVLAKKFYVSVQQVLFRTAGNIVTPVRSSMKPETLDMLTFLCKNLD
jgi:hypothetical protein